MNSLSHVTWRKSSRSSQEGACVDVAGLGGAIAVRDSRNLGGPALVFGRRAFAGLVQDVRSGLFD